MLTVHASALKRLVNCNGSRLTAGALAPVVSGGDEGTAAKFVAHSGLRGVNVQSLIGTPAPNGVFITADMVEHTSEFLAAIGPDRTGALVAADLSFQGAKWRVETVADHVTLRGQTLFVDQFYYGWGIVEPDNNYELIANAIGYCAITGAKPEAIVMTVHQPRPAHPLGNSRDEAIEYKQLMRHRASIDEVLSAPGTAVRSGMSWCRKCPALSNCAAAQGAAMNAIDYIAEHTDAALENDDLAREVEELERAESAIKNRLEALESEISYRVKAGQIVGDWRVGPALGNRTWNAGLTPDILQMLTGKDLRKEGLISPAQAIAAGVPENVVATLAHRPERGVRLFKADADKLAKKLLKG